MAESDKTSDAQSQGEGTAKKKSGKGGLIIGLGVALVLGGASAYAVMSGLAPIPSFGDSVETAEIEAPKAEYLMLEPLTVALASPSTGPQRQLRLELSIQTTAEQLPLLEADTPRILDSLNTFLRAVEPEDLATPAALDRLRAMMLRRIRISTNPSAVQDVLITSYVIL